MTSRDLGPPERDAGRTTPDPADTLTKPNNQPKPNAANRQCGRYAAGVRRGAELWREGYCRGFLAALVDVARASNDPEVWCLLDRVGENFTLPTADGYELVGGDD